MSFLLYCVVSIFLETVFLRELEQLKVIPLKFYMLKNIYVFYFSKQGDEEKKACKVGEKGKPFYQLHRLPDSPSMFQTHVSSWCFLLYMLPQTCPLFMGCWDTDVPFGNPYRDCLSWTLLSCLSKALYVYCASSPLQPMTLFLREV